jgi:hypothetical protein
LRSTGGVGRSVVSRVGFYDWLTRPRSRSDEDVGAKFVPAFWRAIETMAPGVHDPLAEGIS